MNVTIKKFEELTKEELYEIMHCRQQVFAVEQGINYQDLDYLDQKSEHLFVRKDDCMIAYLRIINAGIKYPEISIGRVLTLKEYRHKGYSRKLLETALSYIKEKSEGVNIKIEAQAYLEGFYCSIGFKKISEPFILEGISHIEMIYETGER